MTTENENARGVTEVPGLRDAVATDVKRDFGFFGNLHGKAIPVDDQTYRDIADTALAALRQSLREHPEWIADLGMRYEKPAQAVICGGCGYAHGEHDDECPLAPPTTEGAETE